jgi:membrane protein implicated in regulation of membrane protease activity
VEGQQDEREEAEMRYGFQCGTGSSVVWGLVALLLGLIGLAFPLLFVVVAVALTARAVLWARRPHGTDTAG